MTPHIDCYFITFSCIAVNYFIKALAALMQVAHNAATSLIVLYLFLAANAATHRLIF